MNKVYRYRKHILWGQYAIPIFAAVVWLLILVLLAVATLASSASGESTLTTAAGGSLIVIVCITLLFLFLVTPVWYLYYRMAGISIAVSPTQIIYTTRQGQEEIPLNNITKLETPSLSYMGGWLKIVTPKQTIRLTVVIKDLSEFMLALKKALDEQGLSDRYDRAKLFAFLKTAVFADQSWARIYDHFWKLLLFILFTPTMLYTLICYAITEAIFGRRVANQANEEGFSYPPRDIKYEREIYRKTFLIGGIIYLALIACALIPILLTINS